MKNNWTILKQGILSHGSGSIANLIVQKNNVIRLQKKSYILAKRTKKPK